MAARGVSLRRLTSRPTDTLVGPAPASAVAAARPAKADGQDGDDAGGPLRVSRLVSAYLVLLALAVLGVTIWVLVELVSLLGNARAPGVSELSFVLPTLFLGVTLSLLLGAALAPKKQKQRYLLAAVVSGVVCAAATEAIALPVDLFRDEPKVRVASTVRVENGPTKPIRVEDVAAKVPECIAVLAQLDELADDEPRVAGEAVRADSRDCALLAGRAEQHRYLATLGHH
jgi:hypothetical protein